MSKGANTSIEHCVKISIISNRWRGNQRAVRK